MTQAIYIVSGFILLFLGGEGLLRGSVSLARTFKVSKLLIGAVIIGFGTSTPELTVSVGAALKGSPDIALGNVIGSNIANILLIVGVSALMSPILVTDKAIRRDLLGMMLSSGMLVLLMWLDMLNFVAGVIFLLALSGYIGWSFIEDRRRHSDVHDHMEEDSEPEDPYNPSVAIFLSVLGIVALVGGATLLVDGAISVARDYGISEAVIGLTLVAIGSSLPELATAIVASIRQHNDIVLGNIIGSSIFNVFAILGVTLLIRPIPVAAHMMSVDVWVMLGASAILCFLILKQVRINAIMGLSMLGAYGVYLFWLYSQNMPV